MEITKGSEVILRDWDDLLAEYGVDFDGDIAAPRYIPRSCKRHCGQSGRVASVDSGGNIEVIFNNGDNRFFNKESLYLSDTIQDVIPGHIVVIAINQYTINSHIDKDFVIKAFTADKCILEYQPTHKLKDSNENMLHK